MRRAWSSLVLVCLFVLPLQALPPAEAGRYVLILKDPPVAEALSSVGVRATPQSFLAKGPREAILAKQSALRDILDARHFAVYGAMQHLLNAVFVTASASQVEELKSLPGVLGVVPVRRYKPQLNRAVQLVNAPAAWNLLGGVGNAGLGQKIAILDTGIDNTHPVFQDASLSVPPNFPICPQPSDCQYTSNKILVARSYTHLLVGSDPASSRPDDYSARDLIGHGTAVASVAAGETTTGPLATITGMAPRAYLGNYKVFGSGEINGYASSDSIDQALEDAVKDGMNVAVLSLGGPAFSGPADAGSICGQPAGVACDIESVTIKNAVAMGMSVVVADGNDGYKGGTVLNSVDSPGVAPEAITVAALTNSHVFASLLGITGPDVPSSLRQVADSPGDSVRPNGSLTAPLADASKVGDTLGCSAFPAGSLNNSIALIQRGTCTFAIKTRNAYVAGAVGVVFTNYAGDDATPAISGLTSASIPSVIIGASDGDRLRTLLASGSAVKATISPDLVEQPATGNAVADFSSRGPAVGQGALKPDIAAVGTDIYMAAQRSDPNGDVYSLDGFTIADGTSFSTPMVAGAAALVRQKNPTFTPPQIKSALVNSAVRDSQGSLGTANVLEVGGGRLDAGAAVASNVTIEPATVSFGVLTGSNLPKSQQFVLTNFSGTTLNLTLSVNRVTGDAATQLTLDQSALTLAPGGSGTVTLTLSGSKPGAGDYQGAIEIGGAAVPLHIPYLYAVGDGVPKKILNLAGDSETGTVGQSVPDGFLAFKVIDQYGVPVTGLPVTFTLATAGQGSLSNADRHTDAFGIAGVNLTLPSTPCTGSCSVVVNGTAGALSTKFTNNARPMPTIAADGIVDAASFKGGGIVPGSYISLFGTGLADSSQTNNLPFLPLALNTVFVSFDSGSVSYPGRMYYVSPTQVNVQVPWELQGQTSAQIKVTIDFSAGNVITVPVVSVSPAIFAYTDSTLNTSIAAALDESNAVVNGGHPVARGHVVQLYVNGLGAVNNTPASGAPAPASPLATTLATPTVSIGGQPALVQFSGLAPGFSGLYQVNAVVPANLGAGVQPVVVSSGGLNSPAAGLPVQ